jgi:hypothetical protein
LSRSLDPDLLFVMLGAQELEVGERRRSVFADRHDVVDGAFAGADGSATSLAAVTGVGSSLPSEPLHDPAFGQAELDTSCA